MCDTAFVCVHVLTYIISQPCINILVSKLIWVHLLWIYLLKKKAAGSLSTSSWQVEGRTLSLSHDALELLHIFAFVHTSVMKRPGSDFVVVVVNVTHIWVDLQIHLVYFCRSELNNGVFRWRIYVTAREAFGSLGSWSSEG